MLNLPFKSQNALQNFALSSSMKYTSDVFLIVIDGTRSKWIHNFCTIPRSDTSTIFVLRGQNPSTATRLSAYMYKCVFPVSGMAVCIMDISLTAESHRRTQKIRNSVSVCDSKTLCRYR
uniref:Uncharacterized protein n=1 Tax=Arundo donax TaxID=35708 RepID=A0A0A9GB47_ARUDO